MRRSLLIRVIPVVLALSTICCGKSEERRLREQAQMDSLRREDSLRKAWNPYKLGQGNDAYNRQRENLGDLNKLVTPDQPQSKLPERK